MTQIECGPQQCKIFYNREILGLKIHHEMLFFIQFQHGPSEQNFFLFQTWLINQSINQEWQQIPTTMVEALRSEFFQLIDWLTIS